MQDIKTELTQVVRSFIQKKYKHVREVKITRVTEGGPTHGLNFYRLEGTTNVLLGDTPALQAKRFHITVYATRDGRIIDQRGNVQ